MRGSSVLLPALLAAPFATANRPAVRPLNEQVALVTGASSGIGLQAAKYLAAQGTAVVLAARRTDRLNAAVTEITEAGGRAVVASCDVRRGDMLKAAVTLAEEIFGGLDFVFANAGSFSMGEDELEAAEDEQLAMNVAVNLIGSGLLTLKYALPALKRRGGGAVVFTSSIAAYFNKVTGAAYEQMTAINAASKAGLDSIANVGAGAFARHGIRLYSLNLALYESEMSLGTLGERGSLNQFAAMINPYHKEKAGHPREIAKVIAHIADNSTLWPSGSLVTVDGDSTISSEVFHRARFQPGLPELLGMPSPAELKEHLRDHRGGPYLQVKDEV
ncbi:short chain dehydrogenase [Emiliania huxleyi CCMP1516]|uniref:Uncharacterized protein n=2 Tax=Emiliania huxleyi TaxID=2903 RepID=A0A0D3JPM6_EMIH1|nr:short chain dehydrogenase [Emiliania huxleyi CCMP1516]EOD25461.1 short chain dehydrogenase [Emiliania huxleyi CCMP1516]|eukprot:XP_005777890.1 short chain dehydrogenase [Emiliania huxleyi CCMP1516]